MNHKQIYRKCGVFIWLMSKKKPRTQKAGATDYKTVKRVLRSVDDQKLIPEMVAILNMYNVSSRRDLPHIHSLAERDV